MLDLCPASQRLPPRAWHPACQLWHKRRRNASRRMMFSYGEGLVVRMMFSGFPGFPGLTSWAFFGVWECTPGGIWWDHVSVSFWRSCFAFGLRSNWKVHTQVLEKDQVCSWHWGLLRIRRSKVGWFAWIFQTPRCSKLFPSENGAMDE